MAFVEFGQTSGFVPFKGKTAALTGSVKNSAAHFDFKKTHGSTSGAS
jgi:hypothetical protein